VLELQKAALESKTSATELLRRALLLAKKLDVAEFQTWIELELNGYSRKEDIPPYRRLRGELVANHPVRGWTAIRTDALPLDLLEKMETFLINYPIGEIESALRDQTATTEVVVGFDPQPERVLRGLRNYPAEPGLRYPIARFQGIVDAIRTIVLEWSLRLEKDGVLGEGMSFSMKEKEAASSATYYIQNYISQVTHSQIQQNTQDPVMRGDISPLDLGAVAELLKAVEGIIAQSNLDSKQLAELKADVSTIETQLNSPKPKESIIREGLRSVRNILEGAAGSALAAGALTQIGRLLG
jgi:hypothetical protein